MQNLAKKKKKEEVGGQWSVFLKPLFKPHYLFFKPHYVVCPDLVQAYSV